MTRIARTATLFVAVCLLSGCVVLPFATPPVEYSGAIGGVAGSDSSGGAVPLRATVYPGGVVDELHARDFELGGGYSLLLPLEGGLFHGPSVALGAYRNYAQSDDRLADMWRVGLHVMPGLGFESQSGNSAFQMAARITGEWVTWADGPFDSCNSTNGCAFGWAYGETSVGLFAEASYWAFDDEIWTVSAGLLFRAPATLGVLLAALWN